MNNKILKLLFSILVLSIPGLLQASSLDELIRQAMAGDHRDPGNSQRDQYRHPRETLEFFGLKPDWSVVEIWPSSGWYTEILAPVLRGEGIFYAAGFAPTADRTPQWRKDVHKRFTDKLESRPDVYDHVVVTELSVPERTVIAPPGTADLVVTFRNVHNWMKGDYELEMFEVMNRALKPGGILGVVEHRAKPGTSIEKMKESGYVTEDYVIEIAERAGFRLEARAEINANPADGRDHPAGVWTLPPSLRYCRQVDDAAEKSACMEQYRAIGESDRMTLRFRKVSKA